MNFVVGLSENLLTECRRLNAENSKYREKLKSALDEVQNYKDEVFKLKDFNKSHNTNEQALKDKNWELESKVIKLDDELSVLKKSHEKLFTKTPNWLIRSVI